ncbi:3-oxoacyl-ACP reductase [Meridianimarinicoccus roseus]|uniref:3-oxoacyl-ACP reductase n=1 Tax=Meridianimarinicoccus roseus TaxID=2072018 RepID=A0A2V2LB97_9RHOB|nr:SDR family oxidoreductase [Meridianimarinicoccus roseus]PWR00794.1 3-oxoacyl-ACP reductase [Meridianimarinicoccus roseus]
MTDPARFPDLDGASVFVTGGGSGIGAAFSDGLMAQGAKVAFVQRSDAGDFCDEMERRHGTRPLFLPCDITDISALQAAIAHAAKAHGTIDVLVNNAANDKRHSTLEVDEAFWDWSQAINLKAYFFAAQAVLPGMREMGRGSIVNLSSISYMMGNAGYPAYTAANGAITALTRSLAREFGPDGIRVNALAPGWVFTQKQIDLWATEEGVAAHLARQCLPRMLKPEEMVEPLLFLASQASRAMTGQTLAVDGGVVVSG